MLIQSIKIISEYYLFYAVRYTLLLNFIFSIRGYQKMFSRVRIFYSYENIENIMQPPITTHFPLLIYFTFNFNIFELRKYFNKLCHKKKHKYFIFLGI